MGGFSLTRVLLFNASFPFSHMQRLKTFRKRPVCFQFNLHLLLWQPPWTISILAARHVYVWRRAQKGLVLQAVSRAGPFWKMRDWRGFVCTAELLFWLFEILAFFSFGSLIL